MYRLILVYLDLEIAKKFACGETKVCTTVEPLNNDVKKKPTYFPPDKGGTGIGEKRFVGLKMKKKTCENPITNSQMVSNYNVRIVSRDVIRYKFEGLSLSLLSPLSYASSHLRLESINLFPVHTLTDDTFVACLDVITRHVLCQCDVTSFSPAALQATSASWPKCVE